MTAVNFGTNEADTVSVNSISAERAGEKTKTLRGEEGQGGTVGGD